MKVTQSVSFDFDDFNFLVEIKSRYHRKNISEAIHSLIYYYKILSEQHAVNQKIGGNQSKDTPRKHPMNPQVMG